MPSIQDIFQTCADDFIVKRKPPARIRKVIGCIKNCKTIKLGGHVSKCKACCKTIIHANSCRNRHCGKCQYLKQIQWVSEQMKKLMDISYFHIVFTLPKELRQLCFYNQELIYNLVLKAASRTLSQLSASKRHFHAQIGFTAILHTWTQQLLYHPHIHCVVTGGGMSMDGNSFIESSSKFFLPVKVVSRKFRGKFLCYLKKAYNKGKLKLPGDLEYLKRPFEFANLLYKLHNMEWVVYTKEPFSSPENVLKYLGRYTHRVTISDARIKAFDNGMVTFEYTDRKDGCKKKLSTITADELILRFCMHILPDKFVKIRHFGLHANANINTKLKTCQRITDTKRRKKEFEEFIAENENFVKRTGQDFNICPHCGGPMEVVASFSKGQAP